MKTDHFSKLQRRHNFGKVVAAFVLIFLGLFFLGHNLGFIDSYLMDIFISWPMLLVFLGLVALIRRSTIPGVIMLCIGAYFLLPRIAGLEGVHDYWPMLLIVIGVVLLFRRNRFMCFNNHWHNKRKPPFERVEDGFVTVDISFGSSRHIVLDPVFRGADIDVSFGSVALDLRKTTLDAAETYLDLDCSFSGAELLIPSEWNLIIQVDNSLSGIDDKRRLSREIDYAHKLILRGDLSFSGVEIKD